MLQSQNIGDSQALSPLVGHTTTAVQEFADLSGAWNVPEKTCSAICIHLGGDTAPRSVFVDAMDAERSIGSQDAFCMKGNAILQV